jgi:hypothetical protein
VNDLLKENINELWKTWFTKSQCSCPNMSMFLTIQNHEI